MSPRWQVSKQNQGLYISNGKAGALGAELFFGISLVTIPCFHTHRFPVCFSFQIPEDELIFFSRMTEFSSSKSLNMNSGEYSLLV